MAPLVNLENTLLLFTTFIFHYHYFGAEHGIADFFALDGVPSALYSYGAFVLLVSLIRIPADWQGFVAFMLFLGNALISIAYTSLFWMQTSTPTWPELAVQFYYLLQAVISLALVILLLTQEKGKPLAVNPRVGGVPGTLKALAILAYVVGMTLLLHRRLSVAPAAVTAQVNLYGALLLEALARLFSSSRMTRIATHEVKQ